MSKWVTTGVVIGWLMLGFASTWATADNISPQAVIGWKLFFDPLLSRPKNTSCATCHDPAKGYGDGLPLGKGAYGQTLPRHTPSVVNLQNAPHLFWDGRVQSLKDQAIVPLTNPIEMDMTPPKSFPELPLSRIISVRLQPLTWTISALKTLSAPLLRLSAPSSPGQPCLIVGSKGIKMR